MDEKNSLLRAKVHEMMIKSGFEEKLVNHQLVYYICNKYVKITYENKYAAVEAADSLMEAENNMYEDLDLYDYDFMKGKDISKEIEKDVAKYVLGILN